jgi:alcohol dehydrogenase class IV
MDPETPAFNFDYKPSGLNYGRGSITDVTGILENNDLDTVLAVCGSRVAANAELMDPVEDELGDNLAGVFAETTPEKRLQTVFRGVDRVAETGADAIIAIGGGSSIDVAKGICAFSAGDRTYEEAFSDVLNNGELGLPDAEQFLSLIAVPTTLAGADLSIAAGLVADTEDGPVEPVLVDNRLMPLSLIYDPNLFETTPITTLAGSAINGFDKGVEAIYSRFANPITDATAVKSLNYLRSSLPNLIEAEDPAVMDQAVAGIVLAQYGVSMPNHYKINIIHAFGHALRNQFGIQQGVAHAVVVPKVLSLIFDEGCGRPELLAEGLLTGGEDADDSEAAIIESVEYIRDGLGLPSTLRELDGTSKSGLRATAEHTAEDPFLNLGPVDFDPSVEAIEQALNSAW